MTTEKNDAPVWESNPARRLEAGFKKIRNERMKGLPICNKFLGCQAVGFQKWKYFWFGVMVTPWAINLIMAPGVREKWKSVPEGRRLHYQFPAGLYDFISVHDSILGEYQMCSMISPLHELEFPSHSFAVDVAKAITVELMKPEEPPEEGIEIKPLPQKSLTEKVEDAMQAEVSRRELFTEPAEKVQQKIAEA